MHISLSVMSRSALVEIGPIETAVIFAGLTSGIHHKERRSFALGPSRLRGWCCCSAAGGNCAAGRADWRQAKPPWHRRLEVHLTPPWGLQGNPTLLSSFLSPCFF